jgi:ribosomal protein L12E/L44/L45/RPP1/RPP2
MHTVTRSHLPLLALALLALPHAAQSDYVADDSEIAAMKARIKKNPPTAATLTAAPYPGSKLDLDCSADQSASNGPDTMVYCLYTKDSLDQVKAYLAGQGKPAAGVNVFPDRGDVAENGYVTVADVTIVRYYINDKRIAEARQQAANSTAAPAQPDAAPAAAAASTTPVADAKPATASTPEAEPQDDDGSAAVQDAVDTAKKLKGLFGR